MSPAEPGRTTQRCVCPQCGHVNYFYVWSWAGNGWARCKHCRVRIGYYNHDAKPDA